MENVLPEGIFIDLGLYVIVWYHERTKTLLLPRICRKGIYMDLRKVYSDIFVCLGTATECASYLLLLH